MAFKQQKNFKRCLTNIMSNNLKNIIKREGVCSLISTLSSKFEDLPCKDNVDSFFGFFASFLLIFLFFFGFFISQIDLDPSFFFLKYNSHPLCFSSILIILLISMYFFFNSHPLCFSSILIILLISMYFFFFSL